MAIGQHVYTGKIEGLVLNAFQLYCSKRGIQTSGEGIRTLIRDTSEYKALYETFIDAQDNNQDEESQENSCPDSENYPDSQVAEQTENANQPANVAG